MREKILPSLFRYTFDTHGFKWTRLTNLIREFSSFDELEGDQTGFGAHLLRDAETQGAEEANVASFAHQSVNAPHRESRRRTRKRMRSTTTPVPESEPGDNGDAGGGGDAASGRPGCDGGGGPGAGGRDGGNGSDPDLAGLAHSELKPIAHHFESEVGASHLCSPVSLYASSFVF